MGYYKLIRKAPEGKAVHGNIYRVEHRYSGSTGQYKEYLTPICDTLENADFLIPALTYRVAVTMSPRFNRVLPILCQVPGRTGIRIHYGTKPSHSLGCVLVTDKDKCREVVQMFTDEQNEHAPIYLEICESRPGDPKRKYISIPQAQMILHA